MALTDILTSDEIEQKVMVIKGTWIKRKNARARFVEKSNAEVMRMIYICKSKVRYLRATGAKERELRVLYSEITRLELKLL